jgi:hypothetical protein
VVHRLHRVGDAGGGGDETIGEAAEVVTVTRVAPRYATISGTVIDEGDVMVSV